jgi:sterol desaturase/sphingolipid hydroxylase (fatty acid hydroxylase superfamily)
MPESFLQNDALWMSVALYGSISLALFWETLFPRRPLTATTWIRWLNNAGMWLLDTTIQRWLLAGIALSISAYAEQENFGFLRLFALSEPTEIILSILLLDFFSTIKHRLFHAVPLLWRVHTLHHSDLDCDVSTSLRHHPLDYLIDSVISLSIIVAVGASPVALLIYFLVVFSHNSFRHANIYIPDHIDRVLRLFIITPDYHRVHHSSVEAETNSNYGATFPWWDWVMGTYCATPGRGQQKFQIGLQYFRDAEELWLVKMLTQPFRFRKNSAENTTISEVISSH